MAQWQKTRSEMAHAKKRDPNADVSDLLNRMHIEFLADKITATLAEAPPLTAAQVQILRAALHEGTMRNGRRASK